MMTKTLIKQLLSYGDTKITIASNMLNEAKALVAMDPKNLAAVFLDVTDLKAVEDVEKLTHVEFRNVNLTFRDAVPQEWQAKIGKIPKFVRKSYKGESEESQCYLTG